MAANPTPTNDAVLMARLTTMARACAEHGEALGMKINTGEVMETALQAAREDANVSGRLAEARVPLELALDIGLELQVRQLQQFNRLLQLRRHHQGLALAHL